jgi:hypothetical protein
VTHYEGIVRGLRDELGEETYQALWEEDRVMTLEQAIHYTLPPGYIATSSK